ncbi:MAG: hypothetical protein WAW75_03610 [Gallionella sp.]
MPDSATDLNAMLAWIEMQATMKALKSNFKERGWRDTCCRGHNTGRVSVGNMGSEPRLAYIVMGDAVNRLFDWRSSPNNTL